ARKSSALSSKPVSNFATRPKPHPTPNASSRSLLKICRSLFSPSNSSKNPVTTPPSIAPSTTPPVSSNTSQIPPTTKNLPTSLRKNGPPKKGATNRRSSFSAPASNPDSTTTLPPAKHPKPVTLSFQLPRQPKN